MPDLYKARLKCKDIWIRESKGGRIALPGDPPIRAHAGAIDVPWDRPGLGFDANFERIKASTVRELVLEDSRAPMAA